MSSIQSQKSNYHHGNVREELLDEGLAMLSCSLVHGLSHLLLEGRLAESEEKANNLVLLIMNYATSLLTGAGVDKH